MLYDISIEFLSGFPPDKNIFFLSGSSDAGFRDIPLVKIIKFHMDPDNDNEVDVEDNAEDEVDEEDNVMDHVDWQLYYVRTPGGSLTIAD